MDRWIDRWISRSLDRWIDGLEDRWIDGSLDRRIRQIRRIGFCLEILRCYSESISMIVSDIIMYIMNIM